MITEEQVAKFQFLYKSRFGKELSQQEALEQGARLLKLVELIYKPITQADYDRMHRHQLESELREARYEVN